MMRPPQVALPSATTGRSGQRGPVAAQATPEARGETDESDSCHFLLRNLGPSFPDLALSDRVPPCWFVVDFCSGTPPNRSATLDLLGSATIVDCPTNSSICRGSVYINVLRSTHRRTVAAALHPRSLSSAAVPGLGVNAGAPNASSQPSYSQLIVTRGS